MKKGKGCPMFKKIGMIAMVCFVSVSLSGCFFLFAGAAGGAGTAVWLGGKLTQEFHAPYQQTIDAAKRSLIALRLDLVKETRDETVTQLKSKYTDGKEIWIDIRKITANSTKVEVRVGAVHPDKEAADKILKKIQGYL